ncbi:MAG: hypothetical protein FWD33_00350 [Alphaproteobacteria bacterium]|nr:hypothetical protein [Alphaproteobacteria bacterium]
MKFIKMLKLLSLAAVSLAVFTGAADAQSAVGAVDMNRLCTEMRGIFTLLQRLAFIGAAFVIAGWAWGYIKGGEAKSDDMMTKGFGLLVGFVLLGIMGAVMTILKSQCTF